MSDIETLEDLATWALKEYADAIRGVLKENERLRAQVDTLTDVIERIGTTAEARIDAALALLAGWHCVDTYEQTLHDAVVKALKGEA